MAIAEQYTIDDDFRRGAHRTLEAEWVGRTEMELSAEVVRRLMQARDQQP